MMVMKRREPKNNKDVSGIRFGRLIAKEIIYKKPRYWWKCLCDCGNEKLVTLNHLENGAVKSCGCYRTEFKNKIEKGNSYGHWTAIEKSDERDVTGSVMWLCKCRCGIERFVSSSSLSAGKSKSCGCIGKVRLISENKNNKHKRLQKLVGTKFNEFIIEDLLEVKEGLESSFSCRCSCGEELILKQSQLKDNRESCGHLLRGEHHWNYNHELTEEERIANNSRGSNPRYQSFRRSVLKRDGNKCVICDFHREKDMRVHHVYSWNTHTELRYEISNAVTLCPRCHDIQYEGSFHNIYKNGNNTKQQFEEFRNNRKVSNN